MERERSFKIITISALLIAIISLSIGFAAYTETLTINGNAKISPELWKVQFTKDGKNVGELNATLTGRAKVTTEATVAASTISGFKATLKSPGDSVTYNFEISNLGDLDAKLTAFTLGTLSCTPSIGSKATQQQATAICEDLIYTLTYADESDINIGDKLVDKESATDSEQYSKPVILKLSWPSSSTVEVNDDIDVTINTTSLVYTQD